MYSSELLRYLVHSSPPQLTLKFGGSHYLQESIRWVLLHEVEDWFTIRKRVDQGRYILALVQYGDCAQLGLLESRKELSLILLGRLSKLFEVRFPLFKGGILHVHFEKGVESAQPVIDWAV